jgi:hypothetical protein
MIIQFGQIQLDEWCRSHSYLHTDHQIIWRRRKLIPYQETYLDQATMVNIRQYTDSDGCYVNFYHQLSFLHNYLGNNAIKGDLDFTKNYVDTFLIRMNKLTAFL